MRGGVTYRLRLVDNQHLDSRVLSVHQRIDLRSFVATVEVWRLFDHCGVWAVVRWGGRSGNRRRGVRVVWRRAGTSAVRRIHHRSSLLAWLEVQNCISQLCWLTAQLAPLLYSLSKPVLKLEIGGVSILLSIQRQMKKAPYLDYVTINRNQLELYADNLIFKLGKRNA